MSTVRSKPQPVRSKRSPSSDLGGRLRSVLVSPRTGFRSAMRGDVATRAARSPMTAFVVLLAGTSMMALWLKLSSLAQLIDRPRSTTTWSTVLPALVLGGALGIAAYLLWSRFAPRLAAKATADRLRLAWSFADFPLAVYAAVILPLDLLLVGPEIFSSQRLDGSFAMMWGALSVALLLSVTGWSTYLFVRGLQAAAGEDRIVALTATAVGAVSFFYIFILIKELLS